MWLRLYQVYEVCFLIIEQMAMKYEINQTITVKVNKSCSQISFVIGRNMIRWNKLWRRSPARACIDVRGSYSFSGIDPPVIHQVNFPIAVQVNEPSA